jgi:D-alanyl-D-alanine carboxypeptidase
MPLGSRRAPKVRRLVVGLAFMTFSSADAGAQPGAAPLRPTLPASPAGRAVEDLVRDFSANSLDDPRWMRWRQLVGPVEFQGVETLPNGGLRAWVKGTVSRAWLGWEVVPDTQGRVDRARVPVFWLGASAPVSFARRGPLSTDAAKSAAAIADYLAAVSRADLFSGVVLVAYRGRAILERAYGFANREHGERNTMQTRFSMASVGKVFTAAAVSRLVATGRISYADSVGKFLPDYPIVEARSATVGQLLAHQAGVGASPQDWIAMREAISLADLVRLTATAQRFKPGTSTQYSNEGYLIAGRIVEAVSRVPYETFVKRDVFTPAGLTATDWDTIDRPSRGRAVPYSNWRFVQGAAQVFVPGPRRDVTFMHGLKGTPAGGAYTTASDLLAFTTALLDGRLADVVERAQLFAPRGTRLGGATSYGFEVSSDPRSVRKGGNAQGVSAQLDIFPDDGYIVIVLSNYDQAAQVVANAIREILHER